MCDQAGRVISICRRRINSTRATHNRDKGFKRKSKTQGANGWDIPNKPAAPRL
jgi:hypothetical protein